MNDYLLTYRARISVYALLALVLHIPVFGVVAWIFKTEQTVALGLSFFILLGPLVSHMMSPGRMRTLNLAAFALICYSAILIHLGRGMIEFHFHIFVGLALLALSGSMWPVLVGAGTAAAHHIVFYFLFPASVFNYQASFGIVLLHAAFVVMETLGCLYLAKRFGDVLDMQGTTLRSLIKVVSEHVDLSRGLTQSSENLTSTNAEQGETTRQVVQAIQQISQLTNKNSEQAAETLSQAEASFKNLKAGQEQLVRIETSLEEIQQAQAELASHFSESNAQMQAYVKAIQDISVKTKVINEIVFQTKLLSFNASVEAARAGEAGKGFAVVAEEVGSLAEMSGRAAAEIERLLADSIASIKTTSEQLSRKAQHITEQSVHRVENGLTLSRSIIASLTLTLQEASRIAPLVQEISRATQEQKGGITVVEEAVQNLEQISGRSSSIADTNRSQAAHLQDDTHQLKELVDFIATKAS